MMVDLLKGEAIKSNKLNRDKVRQWMDKYWESGERPCPVCCESAWSISAEPIEVKTFRWGKPTGGGGMEILMVITCEICGNSYFINALAAELMYIQE